MRKAIITIPCIMLGFALTVSSCKSTNTVDPNLPTDISDRPSDENSQKYDEAALEKLRAGIEAEISKEKCTNAEEWAFSPMGSKACGGPVSYVAYPKKSEAKILPRIEEYTQKMAAYNKKYNLLSDCMLVMPPNGIKCEAGKPVFIYE